MPRAGVKALWRLSAGLGAAQAYGVLGGAVGLLLFSATLGPEAFGRANLLVSVGMLGSLLASLNVEAGAIRTLPGLTAEAAQARVRAGRTLTVLGSAGLTLVWWGAAARGVLTGPEAVVVSLLVLALALIRMNARHATALGHAAAGAVPRLMARPSGVLIGALAVLGFGLSVGAMVLPLMILIATGMGIAVQQWILRGALPLGAALAVPARAEVATGLALAPSLLMLEYQRAVTLTVAAVVLPGAELGTLALALSLAALPALAVIAVEMAVTPALSRRLVADAGDARGLLQQSAALRLGGFALLAGGMVLVLPLAEAQLFTGYAGLGPLVLWCLVPHLARAILGNPVMILTLRGHPGTVGGLSLGGAVLMAAATGIGGMALGGVGATAGMALAWLTGWTVLWMRAVRLTGIDPSARVLLAGAGSTSTGSLPGVGRTQSPDGPKAAG